MTTALAQQCNWTTEMSPGVDPIRLALAKSWGVRACTLLAEGGSPFWSNESADFDPAREALQHAT